MLARIVAPHSGVILGLRSKAYITTGNWAVLLARELSPTLAAHAAPIKVCQIPLVLQVMDSQLRPVVWVDIQTQLLKKGAVEQVFRTLCRAGLDKEQEQERAEEELPSVMGRKLCCPGASFFAAD